MTDVSIRPADGAAPSREPSKSLREKGADSFHAALGAILANGMADALEAGDYPRAVSFINRGFAEGTPQLGCDLLREAMTVVGGARTWTVQLAPPAGGPRRPAAQSDRRGSAE